MRNKPLLFYLSAVMSSFMAMQVKRLTDNAIVPTRGSKYAAGIGIDMQSI
jgi:hypothetical protein